MTLLGPHNMEKVCVSDFLYLGFLDGERALSLVRLVCMVVSLSVVSSWYSRPKIGNMLLFFVHWLRSVGDEFALQECLYRRLWNSLTSDYGRGLIRVALTRLLLLQASAD